MKRKLTLEEHGAKIAALTAEEIVQHKTIGQSSERANLIRGTLKDCHLYHACPCSNEYEEVAVRAELHTLVDAMGVDDAIAVLSAVGILMHYPLTEAFWNEYAAEQSECLKRFTASHKLKSVMFRKVGMA